MRKKKKANGVIENMLVALIGIVMITAFLVIIFGAFSGINDKWGMRQTAREYLLIMETEGYLTPADQASLIAELESEGLYNISLSGTTTSQVGYGDRIYLCITGTSQIQDMLTIVINRRKCSSTIPNSPGLIRSKIL